MIIIHTNFRRFDAAHISTDSDICFKDIIKGNSIQEFNKFVFDRMIENYTGISEDKKKKIKKLLFNEAIMCSEARFKEILNDIYESEYNIQFNMKTTKEMIFFSFITNFECHNPETKIIFLGQHVDEDEMNPLESLLHD
jgi:hypothetical protein